MDTQYLKELIEEVKNRGGGVVLNYQDKPAVVVLDVEKYNNLLSRTLNDLKPEVEGRLSKNLSQPKIKVLVTGGAGYIGAHVVWELLKSGYEPVVLDNLSTGKQENLLTGVRFVEGDLSDINLLKDLFAQEQFDAVMHFAASIEVEESVREPEKYLFNNTQNTALLLSVMKEYGCKKIIFSSTASVYGSQNQIPIPEQAKLSPASPYGLSKLLAERVIKYYSQFLGIQAVVFRYFNACGFSSEIKVSATHESHLIPIVLEVAKGIRPSIMVYGNDYNTFDGTCVRDYVHVVDIARAHVLALQKMDGLEDFEIFNIGTGRGTSVLEIINKASEVLNRIIPMQKGSRRPGDSQESVADNSKAKIKLNFLPQHSDLENIILSSWNQR